MQKPDRCLACHVWTLTSYCIDSYCPDSVGSGLEPLDSHGSINSATGLRAATSADLGDSSDAAAARKAAEPSNADAHLLTTASRLAVWLMVSEHMLWQRA